MNRTTVIKLAFTAIAAPALALGAPAVAMADSFFHAEATWAGHDGAASHEVIAVAQDGHHGHHGDKGDDGGSFYKKSATAAGPDGASTYSVKSAAR